MFVDMCSLVFLKYTGYVIIFEPAAESAVVSAAAAAAVTFSAEVRSHLNDTQVTVQTQLFCLVENLTHKNLCPTSASSEKTDNMVIYLLYLFCIFFVKGSVLLLFTG